MSDEIEIIDDGDDSDYDNDLAKGDKAERNSKVRQRIEDMLEKKRLKELLDDPNDWDL